MAHPLRALFTVVTAVVQVAAAQAGEVVELSHNPFSRPELSLLPSGRGSGADEGRPGETLELRATLVAPEHAMADVNGLILTIGDEVEGFRLVDVGERRAVLERDGERVVVSLGDEE
ncbi:MAG: hypothetical protein PVF51_04615 [Nitrospirota bacterium]|jgi:hypothetical protein